MKSNIKTLISFILVGISIFSCACKSEQNSSNLSNEQNGSQDSVQNDSGSIYEDTEYDFIKNATTDYTVVYPADTYAGTKIQKAATTIKNLVFEATGANIAVKSDIEYTSTQKIISLGKTRQSQENQGLTTKVKAAGLRNNGYLIETVEDSVYLCANSDFGVLYAAYELMGEYFNYEFYAENCYSLDENIDNCKLKDINLVDIPDFDARTNSGSEFKDEYRTQTYTKSFNDADGNFFVHNIFMLVPPEQYMEEHPKWFTGSTVNDQFCFLAKGDDAEREALKDALVYEITRRLEMQPETDWISICQNDGGKWCTCDYCKELEAQYGYLTAGYIAAAGLINMVAREIKVWNQETCPDRDIKIFFWNYGAVGNPPVKTDASGNPLTDEEGNYIPLDENFVLEDNVVVYFAYKFFKSGDGVEDLTETGDEIFFDRIKRYRANMKNPQFYFWLYSAIFYDYLAPYEANTLYAHQYKLVKKAGGIGCFDQGVYNVQNGTDWYNLENYVSSKLLWDCELDVTTLERNFIKEYYGEAATVMQEFYNEYKAHMTYLRSIGQVGKDAKTAENWPFKTIQRFLGYADKACTAIEPLRVTDPQRYEMLYARIICESITYKHLLLQIYPMYFSVNELEKMKKDFLTSCQLANVDKHNEWNNVESLYAI